MEVILIDSHLGGFTPEYGGGHHLHYYKELLKLESTKAYLNNKSFVSAKKNYVKLVVQKRKYLKPLLGMEAVHFLHFDGEYLAPSALKTLKRSGTKIMGTLHWYPTNAIKMRLLKKSAAIVDLIVVHSDYIKSTLAEVGIKNVKVIDYPVFIPVQKNVGEKKNDGRIQITCLGQTRYDKGLDILAEAFQYLPEQVKNKVEFLVCGEEDDILYEGIKRKALKHDVRLKTEERMLDDNEYWDVVGKTDVIVLPYRKKFAGNSGPMTDGIYYDKFILGPDQGNLGYLIKQYDLGARFCQEEPESLARAIAALPETNLEKHHGYKERLKTEVFREKYQAAYVEMLCDKREIKR